MEATDQSTTPCAFPSYLLDASFEERIEYFKNVAIDHPILLENLNALEVLTAYPTPRNLILVVGGTGTGKTKMLTQLNERIRSSLNAAQRTAGEVGSVYEELRTPTKGTFNFSQVHRALLHSMDVPLINRTRPLVMRECGGISVPSLLIETSNSRLNEHAIEQRFYATLDRKKPRAIVLDEAKALFRIARPRNEEDRIDRLKYQADLCKDLANRAKSTVVLGGAYDFFDLSVASGQNARRCALIHVRPYADSKEDLAGFAKAIMGLLSHLPISHRLDPPTVAMELFLQGLGCIGLAAGILTEALRDALVRNVEMTIDLVRRNYYPAEALNVMRAELRDGMQRVDALTTMEDLAEETPSAASSPSKNSSTNRSRRLKPGETKPSNMANRVEGW